MDSVSVKYSLAVLIFLLVVLNTDAGPKEDEIIWKKRGDAAKVAARQAYQPNPYIVSDHLNNHVHKSVESNTKHTRRGLGMTGSCTATNPIDQCWRCQDNWADKRERLADCSLGFGHQATGGKGGATYVVNDSSDGDMVNPKPGTLRHAVIQSEPLWITFSHDMVIKLAEELIMTSNKTIDGRGAQIDIAHGAGLTLQFISNVIIHNIRIHDISPANGGTIRDSTTHFGQRTRSDGDGIGMFGASNVWIDHVSLARCSDGLIDAIQGSTAITISNCYFAQHNDVMLLGASDSSTNDEIMQVTVAFNHFGPQLIQRMPRVRWGFAHVVNNDYTRWEMYAIGGSQHPTILSQGNRFVAPDNPSAKEVTKRDYSPESVWKNWVWKSEGDVLVNGAVFVQSGDPSHTFAYPALVAPKSGQYVSTLTQFAGPLSCAVGKGC